MVDEYRIVKSDRNEFRAVLRFRDHLRWDEIGFEFWGCHAPLVPEKADLCRAAAWSCQQYTYRADVSTVAHVEAGRLKLDVGDMIRGVTAAQRVITKRVESRC